MTPEAAKRALADAVDDEEPVLLGAAVLGKLTVSDVPEGARYEIGTMDDGVTRLAWNGSFSVEDGKLVGEADHTWTRKYWYSPLGLEQYLDLVRRAVEVRQRVRGDVALLDHDDDGAYVHLRYRIAATDSRLDKAYAEVVKIDAEIVEAAEQAADEVGARIAEVAARLSDWGANSLDGLVNAVDGATSADEKGRALEELCARLFSSVPGFVVKQRIRTETEEIDISVVNGSSEPRLAREGAVILVECKNWSGRCGKNEFVIFHEKMQNRSRRCSLGFLVSWNGFTETVTKEMLRGSREELVVVPLTGADIRAAVREDNFTTALLNYWDKAVAL
ncbi:restriction endonuclease [Agrobacterium salinitolerans]|uniref:restriction endonuclease n=1 Tax=Agrobacterium salinitolerans TaxID=1183413 RepID=UPI0035B162F1